MNEPAAVDLVLVPGLNNTRAVFDGVVDALPANIRAHALDNPPLETVEAIAHAHLAVLPERFWLAGFSFGGYVALAMLAAAPKRIQGIALICTTPLADSPEVAGRRLASLQAVQEGRYFEMIEAQAPNAFHPDSLRNAALMAQRRAMVHAYGPERFAAHVRATAVRSDRRALLDGSKPTLVIAASSDSVFPASALASYALAIPGAEYTVIEQAGHLVPMERPAAVATALYAWVNKNS